MSTLTLISLKQIGLKAATFHLTSTASLEYDKDQYIFFSTGSSNNPPIRKVIEQCRPLVFVFFVFLFFFLFYIEFNSLVSLRLSQKLRCILKTTLPRRSSEDPWEAWPYSF